MHATEKAPIPALFSCLNARSAIHDKVNSCSEAAIHGEGNSRRKAIHAEVQFIREKRSAFLRVPLIRHAFVVTPSPHLGEGFWNQFLANRIMNVFRY